MLALDSVFHQNSVFGQLRTLIPMSPPRDTGASCGRNGKIPDSPAASPITVATIPTAAPTSADADCFSLDYKSQPIMEAEGDSPHDLSSTPATSPEVSQQPTPPNERLEKTKATLADCTPAGTEDRGFAVATASGTIDAPVVPTQAQRPPKKERRRQQYYTLVEQGSLYDIMHDHSGLSLFVRPIAWTSHHNRTLNVNWAHRPAITSPTPTTVTKNEAPRELHADVSRLCKLLSSMFSTTTPLPFFAATPIYEVFKQLFPQSAFNMTGPDGSTDLKMWFDGRPYRDGIRVQVMWDWPMPEEPEDTSDPFPSFKTESTQPAKSNGDIAASQASAVDPRCGKPMVAFIGRSQLAYIRSSLFRVIPCPNGVPNLPVARLQSLRSKFLTPADADCDPHFAGILLAMAQAHIYPRRVPYTKPRIFVPPRVDFIPEFRDVTVRLITSDSANSEFVVYKATVTADYLRQFHYPNKAFGQDGQRPSLDIEITKVPTWPLIGLKERLGQALSEEIAGPFDPENPVQWTAPPPPPSPAWSLSSSCSGSEGASGEKRRRHDQSGFVDGSCDKESPEVRKGGKRRKLGEEGLGSNVEVAT